MLVHVLLYDAGQDSEGIHSLELSGSTVVLMFENPDDAERYAGLLEAQDFPVPSIEALDREEIEIFCRQAGYEARLVESGFVPKTDEERLLLKDADRKTAHLRGELFRLSFIGTDGSASLTQLDITGAPSTRIIQKDMTEILKKGKKCVADMKPPKMSSWPEFMEIMNSCSIPN